MIKEDAPPVKDPITVAKMAIKPATEVVNKSDILQELTTHRFYTDFTLIAINFPLLTKSGKQG
jgi:hypothetical protein